MARGTGISWSESTFNPWIGCTQVSEACNHCYAKTQDDRRMHTAEGWGKGKPRKRTTPFNWKNPVKWNALMIGKKTRMRVFCASMCDILDPEVDDAWRENLWKLIDATPNLDWQLLTKHPHLYKEKFPERWLDPKIGIPAQVWCGCTVELQKHAEARINHLLELPAEVRFLSAEPLLGPLDLTKWLPKRAIDPADKLNTPPDRGIQWVIVGGETGGEDKNRPMHPTWASSIRDQCHQHRFPVPLYFKQWGDYRHVTIIKNKLGEFRSEPDFIRIEGDEQKIFCPDPSAAFERIDPSKDIGEYLQDKAVIAVRKPNGDGDDILDGRQYHEYPPTSYESNSHIRVNYTKATEGK